MNYSKITTAFFFLIAFSSLLSSSLDTHQGVDTETTIQLTAEKESPSGILPSLFKSEEIPIYFDPSTIKNEYDYVSCKKINVFGKQIPLYDFLMGFWERKSNRALIEMIEPSSAANNIVQLGLGTGYLTGLVCKKFPNATLKGFDLSAGMIECTKDYLINNGHEKRLSNDTITLNQEDCRTLPIGNNSCDLIVSSYLIDLMQPEDIVSVLKEVQRILKPGKKAYLLGLTADIELHEGLTGKLKEFYFRLGNISYKWCYNSTLLRKLSHALFNGYYTHCRPIDLCEHVKQVAGIEVTQEKQTYIQIIGIPYLPVKIIEVVKK